MKNIMNSYFVKTHKLEISITIIAIVLFAIYFIGAPNVFTRFPIYRAFMQSMPFFGIIAISATFVVTLGEIDLSFPSIVGITSLTFGMVLTATDGNFLISFAFGNISWHVCWINKWLASYQNWHSFNCRHNRYTCFFGED